MQVHDFDYRCSSWYSQAKNAEDGQAVFSHPYNIRDRTEFETAEDYINSNFMTIA